MQKPTIYVHRERDIVSHLLENHIVGYRMTKRYPSGTAFLFQPRTLFPHAVCNFKWSGAVIQRYQFGPFEENEDLSWIKEHNPFLYECCASRLPTFTFETENNSPITLTGTCIYYPEDIRVPLQYGDRMFEIPQGRLLLYRNGTATVLNISALDSPSPTSDPESQ